MLVTNYLKMQKRQQVLALLELGWTYRRIESETGVRRETVSRYDARRRANAAKVFPGSQLPGTAGTAESGAAGGPATANPAKVFPGSGPPGRSAAAAYHGVVLEKLESGLTIQRVWQDLVEEYGYGHSYESVKRYTRGLQKTRQVVGVFHSAPGEEAQVDFFHGAPTLKPETGQWQRPWVFRMTLCHSRHGYEEAVWSQKLKPFLRCHENAFRDFGGVPGVVRHDYVPRHVIVILCPDSLRGRGRGKRAEAGRSTLSQAHNRSQAGEPGEQSLVIPPHGPSGECRRSCGRRLAHLQRRLLRADVDLGVPVGGVEADVTEPSSDHVDFHAGLEQVDCCRVAKDVRADRAETVFQVSRMTAHDLVGSEARQRATTTRCEDRLLRRARARSEQSSDLLDGLGPQRASPPLVTLPMETDASGREIEIANTEVYGFLNSRTRVVEEQDERPIPHGVPSGRWQLREEGCDLIALQEARIRWWHSLRWDRRDALGDSEHLGGTHGQVLEESMQHGQALVARPRVVVANSFEMAQEAEHSLERQVSVRQLRDPTMCLVRDEAQEQLDAIPIAAH